MILKLGRTQSLFQIGISATPAGNNIYENHDKIMVPWISGGRTFIFRNWIGASNQ